MKLTYENPNFPPGYRFGIAGIGYIANGESREITEDQEQSFVSLFGKTLQDTFEGSSVIALEGTANITDVSEFVGTDVSDTVSGDPSAMNLDAEGNVFEGANVSGTPRELDEFGQEVLKAPEEEEASQDTTTDDTHVELPASVIEGGGS